MLYIDCNKLRDRCIIGGGDRDSWWLVIKKKKKEIVIWLVVWYFVFVVVLFYLFGVSYLNIGNLCVYVYILMYGWLMYLIYLLIVMFVKIFCVLNENWIE